MVSRSYERHPLQRKAVDLIAGPRHRQAGLTMDILKEKNRLTDEKLDQLIPGHKLFDIAKLIPTVKLVQEAVQVGNLLELTLYCCCCSIK